MTLLHRRSKQDLHNQHAVKVSQHEDARHDVKRNKRRSSGLRFFASGASAEEVKQQAHAQWEEDYIHSLRTERPTRPGGSRPLPPKKAASVREPFSRITSIVSVRPPDLTSRAKRDFSNQTYRSASSGSTMPVHVEIEAEAGSNGPYDKVQEAEDVVASVDQCTLMFRDHGARRMEREEAHDLREALACIDHKDHRRRVTSANHGTRFTGLDHTLAEKSSNVPSHDDDESPLGIDMVSQNPSNKTILPKSTSPNKWDLSVKKRSSLSSNSGPLSPRSRMTSAQRRRKVSDGPFQNPDDKIWEETEINDSVPECLDRESTMMPTPLVPRRSNIRSFPASKTDGKVEDKDEHPEGQRLAPRDVFSRRRRNRTSIPNAKVAKTPIIQDSLKGNHDDQSLMKSDHDGGNGSTIAQNTLQGKAEVTMSVPTICVNEDMAEDIEESTSGPDIPSITICDATPTEAGSSNAETTYATNTIRQDDTRGKFQALSAAKYGSRAQCAACGLAIAGKIVSAASDRFHPECFQCFHCAEHLECVAFYPEPQDKYEKRLERIHLRQEGQEVAELPGQDITSDGDESIRYYCHLDFHELFSPRCKNCKTPIEGEVILACGGSYHAGHFFCAECGDPFDAETAFVERDGYAWCTNCHAGRFSGKCNGCRKPVVQSGINALGAEWHQSCFVCTECGADFPDGRFFTKDEGTRPVCVACEEVRLKA